MKVTYLSHSSFLLEWDTCYWLFDYFEGIIPAMDPQKDIFVFCSHSHEDHFSPAVFTLTEKYPSVTYIFSNEMIDSCKQWEQKVHFLENRTDTCLTTTSGDNINIHTLQSTDLGCAFFIQYNGKSIYHAGDLHWWYWEGEDPDWNNNMTADYKKEIEYLKGQNIDLAFTVLDPRQEKDYALGMNYLLKHTSIKHMFPMHFWGDFQIIEKYLQEYPVPERTHLHVIQRNGQSFDIML